LIDVQHVKTPNGVSRVEGVGGRKQLPLSSLAHDAYASRRFDMQTNATFIYRDDDIGRCEHIKEPTI
jgi:hypothetical protein